MKRIATTIFLVTWLSYVLSPIFTTRFTFDSRGVLSVSIIMLILSLGILCYNSSFWND